MQASGNARWRAWTGLAIVVAVGLGGLGASGLAAMHVLRTEQQDAERLIDRYADDASREVTTETAQYGSTLSNLAAAVSAQSDFTADNFFDITSRVERDHFPGASGISFAVSARDNQVARVQAFWRNEGVPGLTLKPYGKDHEHVFVVYSRSFDASGPMPGRDVTQAPEAAEVLRTSAYTRNVMASHTYVLLRDRGLPVSQQQMSFLLAAPVFGGVGTPDEGRLRGWMLVAMRGADFIDDTVRANHYGAIDIVLSDLSGPRPVVVADARPLPHVARDGRLHRARTVVVGQRPWQVQVYATDTLVSAADRRLPALTLGTGILITVLLTVLVAILATARYRALARVDVATAALRRDIERRMVIETRLREREAQLRHTAFHDPLTGLANRTLFYERVDHALAIHRRSIDTMAVFFIDLDGFKEVNDTLGHRAGDALLIEVATRLARCARASDTVARLGGDEFAILTEQITGQEIIEYRQHTEVVADRIVRALRAPFDVDGQPVTVTASIGVALRRDGHRTADDILCSADESMYAAKAAGKDRYVLSPGESVGRPEDSWHDTAAPAEKLLETDTRPAAEPVPAGDRVSR